jgi:hypothetical protein
MWFSKFRICTTATQNYAGSQHKSYKIMNMKMFSALDKAKSNQSYDPPVDQAVFTAS